MTLDDVKRMTRLMWKWWFFLTETVELAIIGLNWSKNLHLDTELNGARMFWNEQLD